MIKKSILWCCLSLFNFLVYGQDLESWTNYPSFSTIKSVHLSGEKVVSSSLGGIFISEQDAIIKKITIQDGLHAPASSALYVNTNSGSILVGYSDGFIDMIDPDTYEITSLRDIFRVDRFNNKSINSFEQINDLLFVATSFGLVIYDQSTNLVENSVSVFGSYDAGISVHDISVSADSIYLATDQGLAAASLQSNLADRNNWFNYGVPPGLSTTVIDEVEYYNNRVYSLIENSIFTFENNSWVSSNIFPDSLISHITVDKGTPLLGVSTTNTIYTLDTNDQLVVYPLDIESAITDLTITNTLIVTGTNYEGTLVYNTIDSQYNLLLPPGPYLNFFSNTLSDESRVLATSSTAFPRTDVLNLIKGYYIYEDDEWQNYNRVTNSSLNGVEAVYSLAMNDSSYYFGSWGSGIIKHNKASNEITVFNASNSNLSGIRTSPSYVVISGISADSRQNVWAVSYLSNQPLNVRLRGTDQWIGFNGLSGNDNYYNLFVDSFDQKWISLLTENNTGLGLLVIDTGDASLPDDDRFVKLTSDPTNGNLPDEKVNAIIQDKNEEVWIGTERGIARFIFPELIIGGGAAEKQAQWLINEDTTQVSRFLLRDVNVTALTVNDANQKWVGSANQGLWLLNEEGSAILKRLTVENSNLISDNIHSISVQNETGEVFIATDAGLVSYLDIPKAPVSEMDRLKVYPNPFRYSLNDQIIIEGLSEISKVRIVGVDGLVLNEVDARGGRISWDGFDYNGNKLGTGVYFVIAYEEDGRQRGIGKVVIVK